jgi:hypothetical protein
LTNEPDALMRPHITAVMDYLRDEGLDPRDAAAIDEWVLQSTRKWGKRPDLEADLAFQRDFHAFRVALAPRAGQGRDLRISYTWLEARSPDEVRQALQHERIADRIRELKGEELSLKMEDGAGAEIQILATGAVVRVRGNGTLDEKSRP